MNHYKKKLHDLYAPVSFISLNQKLIERYKGIHDSSINRYTLYCIITLFHNIVVDIGMVFDSAKRTSSFIKFNQYIKFEKLRINDSEEWTKLFDSTFRKVKPFIDLRKNFHAHKNAQFEINEFWEQHSEECDKIPMIAENCIKLFDILSQEILGYKLSFNSSENDIINQFDLIFSKYDS